ncbi:Iron(III)-hydroxamate-binding protein FhuD|nr:Iron(III)-hydroxamate-binding protein FhuD [Candidatus Pantoea persica]
MADTRNYNIWVGEPQLPPHTVDVGLCTEPNLELMTQLQPSLILCSNGYGLPPEKLQRIAPIMGFDLNRGDGKPLSAARWRSAKNSLFLEVMEQLGLTNAWQGETKFWGSAVIGIERLTHLRDVEAICFDHNNDTDMAQLARSRCGRHCPLCAPDAFSACRRSGITVQPVGAALCSRAGTRAGDALMCQRIFPVLLTALFLLAQLLSVINLRAALPTAQWSQALTAPDLNNIDQMLFY